MSQPAERGEVVLVVALKHEARPLIEHFRLVERGPGVPFRVFGATEGTVSLLLSGPGRDAAAAAVAHAAVTLAAPGAGWLNVGIAGHRELDVGSVRLAHRVRCAASDRAWYSPLTFDPPCPTAALTTVDEPCHDYPTADLYDMEGASFYAAAARSATHERVHCLKVVSDNRRQPATALTAADVTALIEAALEPIAAVVETLTTLSGHAATRASDPPGLQDILGSGHFSVTRERRLRRLLRRWAALRPDVDPADWLAGRRVWGAARVLDALEADLDARPPLLRPPVLARGHDASPADGDDGRTAAYEP